MHGRFTHCDEAVQVLHGHFTHCEKAVQVLHGHFTHCEKAVQALHGRFTHCDGATQVLHSHFTHCERALQTSLLKKTTLFFHQTHVITTYVALQLSGYNHQTFAGFRWALLLTPEGLRTIDVIQ